MQSQFLSADTIFQALTLFAIFAHLVALVAVFLLRWGFRPIAVLNIAVALAVMSYAVPRMFTHGIVFDSYLFLLSVSELVVLVASWFSLSGAARAPYATVIAWIGFCGNFLLSAGLFWIAFFFRMTRLF